MHDSIIILMSSSSISEALLSKHSYHFFHPSKAADGKTVFGAHSPPVFFAPRLVSTHAFCLSIDVLLISARRASIPTSGAWIMAKLRPRKYAKHTQDLSVLLVGSREMVRRVGSTQGATANLTFYSSEYVLRFPSHGDLRNFNNVACSGLILVHSV